MRPAEPEKPTRVMRLVESLLRPAMLARPIKNQKLVSEARARLCSRPAMLAPGHFALTPFVYISHLHILCAFQTCAFVCISPGRKHCFSID